jgi:hypothetical protein
MRHGILNALRAKGAQSFFAIKTAIIPLLADPFSTIK